MLFPGPVFWSAVKTSPTEVAWLGPRRMRATSFARSSLRSIGHQRERCEHRAAREGPEVAIRNAEALRLALKLPARERRRRRGDRQGTALTELFPARDRRLNQAPGSLISSAAVSMLAANPVICRLEFCVPCMPHRRQVDRKASSVIHSLNIAGIRSSLTASASKPGILTVGDGRGFVVLHKRRGIELRLVITAAHCLPEEPVAASDCLFFDRIADIAVLGPPDNQKYFDDSLAYDRLLDSLSPYSVYRPQLEGSASCTLLTAAGVPAK